MHLKVIYKQYQYDRYPTKNDSTVLEKHVHGHLRINKDVTYSSVGVPTLEFNKIVVICQ